MQPPPSYADSAVAELALHMNRYHRKFYANDINDELLVPLFRQWALVNFCAENVDFFLEATHFKRETQLPDITTEANRIYQNFIASGAPQEININYAVRMRTMMNLIDPSLKVFDEAVTQILELLEIDCFPRFFRCQLFLARYRSIPEPLPPLAIKPPKQPPQFIQETKARAASLKSFFRKVVKVNSRGMTRASRSQSSIDPREIPDFHATTSPPEFRSLGFLTFRSRRKSKAVPHTPEEGERILGDVDEGEGEGEDEGEALIHPALLSNNGSGRSPSRKNIATVRFNTDEPSDNVQNKNKGEINEKSPLTAADSMFNSPPCSPPQSPSPPIKDATITSTITTTIVSTITTDISKDTTNNTTTTAIADGNKIDITPTNTTTTPSSSTTNENVVATSSDEHITTTTTTTTITSTTTTSSTDFTSTFSPVNSEELSDGKDKRHSIMPKMLGKLNLLFQKSPPEKSRRHSVAFTRPNVNNKTHKIMVQGANYSPPRGRRK